MAIRRFQSFLSSILVLTLAIAGCGDETSPAGGGSGGTVSVVNPTVTTGRNTPVQVTMTATGGQSLSFTVTSAPTNGVVSAVIGSGGSSASVTYTPNQDFVGTDQFGFQASDGTRSATGTATINIVNNAPTAFPVDLQRPSDGGAVTFVLEGSDPEDDPLVFEAVSNPGSGTLSGLGGAAFAAESVASLQAGDSVSVEGGTLTVEDVSSIGQTQFVEVTYTPDGGAAAIDAFSFQVNDGLLSSAPVNVQISINRAPTATDVAQTGFKNDPVPVVLTGADDDGNSLTFEVLTPPAVGSFGLLTPLGSTGAQVVYTPPTDFLGVVDFTFRVSDGLESADGVGTITIIDRVPVASDVDVTTTPGVAVTITLQGMDPDGDPITFVVTDPPTGGTLGPITPQSATTATVVYTPNPTTPGDDFRYVVTAGAETSEKARVSIMISNAKPVADDQIVAVRTDLPKDIVLTGSDGDGDALTFAIDTPPTGGTLGPIVPLGPTSARVTYTPGPGFEGADAFGFTVTDGIQASSPGTVSLTVSNAAPVADPQSLSTDADTPLSILMTGSDADGDPLVFAIVSPPPAGILGPIQQLTPTTARVTYVPTITGLGPNPFTFTVSDGSKVSAAATVVIQVNAVPENSNFSTASNVELFAGGFIVPSTPHVTNPQNPLDGSPSLVIATTGTQPTAAGGSVTLESDGDFRYRPPPGLSGVGADHFDFTTTTGRTGTVTIDLVGPPTWFVTNAVAGPGTGTSWDPLSTLGAAEGPSVAGDRVFLYRGDGTTTGYDAGFTLKAGQTLDGETVGLTVAPFGVLVPAGGRPVLTNLVGTGIDLADGSTVRGLDIAATVAASSVAAAGTAGSTVTDVELQGGPANGITLVGATGTFTFTGVDIDGFAGSALNIDGGDPVATIGLGGHDWSNTTARVATVMNTTGGSVTVSGGTFTDTGDGVRVDSNIGTVDFDLPVTVTSSTARPIELTSSPGAITFADLTIGSTGFTGIHARALGTLTITTGTVSTTGALGVDLEGAALDVTLPSTTVVNGAGGGMRFDSNSGTAALAATDLTSTGTPGLSLTDNTGTFTFTDLDVVSTTTAGVSATGNTGPIDLGTVDITSTTGTGIFALGNGTISATGGTVSSTDGLVVDIGSTAMGFTFASLTSNNSAGAGARFDSNSGTATVGAVDLTSTGAAGLTLSDNTGTFTFTTVDVVSTTGNGVTATGNTGPIDLGTIDLSATTGTGIHALGNGTLSVTGGPVSSTGGPVVDIETTTMGLTFTSLTSNNGSGTGARFVSNTGTADLGLLSLTTTGGPGLFASSGGALTVSNAASTIAVTSAPSIDLTSTTLDGTVASASSTFSGTSGIKFHDHTGTFSTVAGAADFSAGVAVDIDGGGGALSIAADANNSSSNVISVTNRTGGSVVISGSMGETGDGIVVSSNAPTATIDLLIGATVTTASGIGFDAVSGGIVTAPLGITVSTTGTTAVRMDGTTIGAAGMTFDRASSDGATNGIFLRDTGTTGTFTIAGDGSASSGGTITSQTGHGVVLDNVTGVVLNNLDVTSGDANGFDFTDVTDVRLFGATSTSNLGHGIRGEDVTDLDLIFASVAGNGDAAGEHGMFLTEAHGPVLLSNSGITGSASSNLVISNTTASGGGPDLFTVHDMFFGPPAAVALADNISIIASGAADIRWDMDVGSSTNGILGGDDGLDASVSGGAVLDLEISRTGVVSTTGRGMNFTADGAGTKLEYRVTGNGGVSTWSTLGTGGLYVSSTGGADVEGRFNTTAISGVTTGDAFNIDVDGAGTAVAEAVGNLFDAVAAGRGIFAEVGGGAGTMDLYLENNDVTSMGVGAAESILIGSGSGAGGETSRICLNLVAHDGVAGGGAAASDFRLEHFAGTTFELQDFVGDGTLIGDITTWVNTTKLNVGSVSAAFAPTFVASGAACVTPTV